MTRIRTFLSTVLPSMLAGGLLFSSAFGHASVGESPIGFFPAASTASSVVIAQVTPAPKPPKPPRAPKVTPAPAAPPAPPAPPAPVIPNIPGLPAGVSVSFNNGKIKVSGVERVVRDQLKAARKAIEANPKIPKPMRDKLLARIDKVNAITDKRLAVLSTGTDPDKLEEQMEQMGEEIEQAMDGLDDDLEDIDSQTSEAIVKSLAGIDIDLSGLNFNFSHDSADDDNDQDMPDLPDLPDPPDADSDDNDVRDSITDMKDLALTQQQRDQITKLRADSDKNVQAAKKQLDVLSAKLETALADPKVTDATVASYVDQISAQEAVVRKARIIAWVNARRLLDDAQRKQIEDAAKKSGKGKTK